MGLWKLLSAIQVRAACWLGACVSEGEAATITESSFQHHEAQTPLGQALGSKSPLHLVFFLLETENHAIFRLLRAGCILK